MTFRVERCWGGRDHWFQVSDPSGKVSRFRVGQNKDGDRWCRQYAREAKDYLSYFFHIPRRNIRFYHA
jgi:hypothetical protein